MEDQLNSNVLCAEGDLEVVNVADDSFEAGLFAVGHLKDDVVLLAVLGKAVLSEEAEGCDEGEQDRFHCL